MHGLFSFERSDGLDFVPLAARRALDLSGIRLSLEGWRSLTHDVRAALVSCGACATVDAERVRALTGPAQPQPTLEPPLHDEDSQQVPEHVRRVLGEERPLTDEQWRNLGFLGRFALDKLSRRDRANRVGTLWEELTSSPR